MQLPLPGHIDEQVVLSSILPEKDVDGLHPLNMAKLTQVWTQVWVVSGERKRKCGGEGEGEGTKAEKERIALAKA